MYLPSPDVVLILTHAFRYVMANHHLFKLAEQPPADMVNFLRTFSPVPSLVRVRAKELLDLIRVCVDQCLRPSQADLASDTSAATQTHADSTVVTDSSVNNVPTGSAASADEESLWATGMAFHNVILWHCSIHFS
jgi:exosome complex exonuclease RRP6